MLSEQAFYAEHAAKYAKLSKSEKRKRYASYVATQRSQAVVRRRREPRLVNPLSPPQQCLAGYAASLANPFESDPTCLPIFPSPPSQKVKVFARGMLETGSGGFGNIHCNLDYGIIGGTWVYFTTSAYSGTENTTLQLSGTGISTSASNSPYTSTDFGPDSTELKYRLVSLGIRIKYAGTTLNKGGNIRAHVSPNHESIVGHGNYTVFGGYRGLQEHEVNSNWCTLLYKPISRDELDFRGVYSQDNAMAMIIYTPVAGSPFKWEVVGNYEVIGKEARGQTASYTSAQTETLLGNLGFSSNINPGTVYNALKDAAPYAVAAYKAYSGDLTPAMMAAGRLAVGSIGRPAFIEHDEL